MNVLVTGGAGYIGSHAVRALIAAGHHVVVLDDLSTGHRDAVDAERLVQGSLNDRDLVTNVLQTHDIDSVMHFAALSLVGESMKMPAEYYACNVADGLTLLEAARSHGVRRFIYSSTAAVYGEPIEIPIPETHPLNPTSVYGRTKLAFERILEDYASAYGLAYTALRYFNAAGADSGGEIGEDHDPETHLIPRILQVALGQREHITVFGTDYPTPDGTCIRDYVHVSDLADAHVLALEALQAGGRSGAYNLGNATGYSVREVIETAECVVGQRIEIQEAPRREGDPARLVADASRARQELGWVPKFSSLERMITDAWQWHEHHPWGYRR